VHPPSFCPSCKHRLHWYDLIPILSYILLRGKCRYCGVKISYSYLLVEILTAFLFLLSYYHFGLTLEFIFSCFFLSLLEFIAMVDLRTFEVMDFAVYIGIIIGVIFYFVKFDFEGFIFSIKGIIYGAGIMALIFYVSNGKMGEGDIGIAALIGAWLGDINTIVAIFLAFLIGGTIGAFLIILKLKKLGDKLPFGPFLAIGGGITFLKGNFLIELYWRFLG